MFFIRTPESAAPSPVTAADRVVDAAEAAVRRRLPAEVVHAAARLLQDAGVGTKVWKDCLVTVTQIFAYSDTFAIRFWHKPYIWSNLP